MDPTDKKLEKETKKWLSKLEKQRKSVKINNPSKEAANALKNLDAYISDTHHFLKQKDYIRAFEAVVYAWGILDALRICNLVIIEKGGT